MSLEGNSYSRLRFLYTSQDTMEISLQRSVKDYVNWKDVFEGS